MTSPRRPEKSSPRSRDARPAPGGRPPGPARQGKAKLGQPSPSHWGAVADWYDQLVGEDGSEYQKHVVFPGLLEMLRLRPRMRVLDVGCGQGVFCRLLHHQSCLPTGIDAAAALIEHAKNRSNPTIDYRVGDAQHLDRLKLPEQSFDAATCVLAIQNIPSVGPVCHGVANLLKPGGRFIMVMMHPAFRGPKASGWDWNEPTQTQRRWVSHYLSPRKEAILTHPGKGDASERTWTFHRPLQVYVAALARAGLLVDDLQEWVSHKVSDSGPRAPAENVSREEIPMFMAISAVKPGQRDLSPEV